MNLKDFDSTDESIKWVSLVAFTKLNGTSIVVRLPFAMTKVELEKLTFDIGKATREVSTKYLGPAIEDIAINL